MISEDRKNKILTIIKNAGYIRNEKLAAKMFTSTSTIRRNLTELQKMGLVKRNHGGVELADQELNAPLSLRSRRNQAQKKIIAEKASRYLKDNSLIFIDQSSTCLNLVPYILGHKNITVYTNGIELVSLLADSEVDVFIVGGKLVHSSLAVIGEYALKMIDGLQFDAVFFSSSGYSGEIITDFSSSETLLRRAIIEHSKERYFLCDNSKIGKNFNYIVCKRCDLSAVITED